MVEKVRGKFFVTRIHKSSPSTAAIAIELGAVSAYDAEKTPENLMYSKFTPQGKIEMVIDNPPASEFFTLGKVVYVDFTEAPAEFQK
jgi:hypothetical protein